MDPMDFTMDESSNVLAGSTLRYRCLQPQPQTNPQANVPNFASHAPSATVQGREIQHYDPVHESSAWYQHNHSHPAPRPPTYSVSQSIPQWSSLPQPSEPAQHWAHFAEMERRTHDYNSADYRRTFMPWTNDSRGAEGFDNSGYAPPSVNAGNNVSADPTLNFRSQTTIRGYTMGTQQQQQQQQQHIFSRDTVRSHLPSPQSTSMAPHAPASEPRPSQTSSGGIPSSVASATTVPQLMAISGLRSGFSRTARPNNSRQEDIVEASRRRRLAATWDSDDDEESLAEMDRADVARRHAVAAEALFGGDFDDDRSIAALRGAMAGGKRVPSKEALQSLETVKIAELKDTDRTCIICYNEFGISNPEGETENPIRLPKCKHIFGDRCIKKWFEDSDSCPYCRDKLPSELAIRKSIGAYQSYRFAHREQLRLNSTLTQRSRYSSYTPAGVSAVPADMDNHRSPSAALRSQDEYEYLMTRQAEAWGYSSPNRNSNADSPERRRQARGRHGAMRGPHFLGRPTSVGSARPSGPSFTHPPPRNFVDLYSPRRNASSEAATREYLAREVRDRENRAILLASAASPLRASWDQLSSDPSGPAPWTPPPHTGPALPHEEASPPVAVGSGISPRQEVNQQTNPTVSRLSVGSDNPPNLFDLVSDPRTFEESSAETHNQHTSARMPSFSSLLGASQNNGARTSSDSSVDRSELARIDSSPIPSGWGSIN